ncbi:hypothetical protein KYI71_27080, partial [Klebsiella pneumoniae]|nr:hypothetical protein [Klebsiella pneumoniae]MUA96980.1 hypothetical protein [Klebsiella pneumoniae]
RLSQQVERLSGQLQRLSR